jgi:uncharacterized membrane protein YkoI
MIARMTRDPLAAILAALLFTALAASAPDARAGRERWLPDVGQAQGFAARSVAERRISLEQAVAIVQQQTGGRVLDAREQGNGYRVKVLTRRGEVMVVFVDAHTGAIR